MQLYESFKQDIDRMYPEPSERHKVIAILQDAEEQTLNKTVKITRKSNKIRKYWARWYIRLKYGLHLKKPFYPLRLIRNYLLQFTYDILKLNRYVFRGIEFALTFRCNFRCNHCLCHRIVETDTRKELKPEEYRRIVDEAMKLGATTFGMEGGEPFVKKDWEKIVEAWQPKYNHIIVSSNGYLFDESLAKKCSDIGIDTINFSLDSGIPELHDLFRRKKGSYERVMRAIQICKKHGIKVIINTVVHTGNLYTDGLRNILELGEREKIMINILFGKAVGEFKDKNAMLDDKDFKTFYRLAEPYNYWSVHHTGPLGSNHGKVGCPGVKEMFNLTPYGDVMNCANNHIYLGNVRTESLASIRERALKESPFGKYRPCFLVQDKDFINIYYPMLEQKGSVSLNEFKDELKRYEQRNDKIVYPELNQDPLISNEPQL